MIGVDNHRDYPEARWYCSEWTLDHRNYVEQRKGGVVETDGEELMYCLKTEYHDVDYSKVTVHVSGIPKGISRGEVVRWMEL